MSLNNCNCNIILHRKVMILNLQYKFLLSIVKGIYNKNTNGIIKNEYRRSDIIGNEIFI